MAHAHFRRRLRFAERAAKRLVKEERIVSEAIEATRCIGYAAFYFGAKHLHEFACAHERDYADESGGAIFHATQLLQQPGIIEMGGIDAGAAAERIDFDTRVVDEQISFGVRAVIAGLQQCVLLEGSTGLFG